MRNMSTAELGIFFHISRENAALFDHVIDSIRSIYDVCKQCTTKEEHWYFFSDSTRFPYSASFSGDDARDWSIKKESFPAQADYIESSLSVVDMKGKEKKITVYATLNPMRTQTTPMIQNERTVKFSFPNSVWKMIETERLTNAIQSVCINMGASYACVDLNFFCPRSLYRSDFRIFSADCDKLSIEETIPTVCWAQYLSSRMIGNQIDISTIMEAFPLSKVIESSESVSGVWIQLRKEPHQNSANERIRFRELFSANMYELSPFKIAECQIPHMQYVINRLPLRNDEEDALASLRNGQSKR